MRDNRREKKMKADAKLCAGIFLATGKASTLKDASYGLRPPVAFN